MKPLNKSLGPKFKKVIFIQSLTGMDKQGASLCWLEVLLAGEHQAQFGNIAFITNSSVAWGSLAGMLWRTKTEIDLSPQERFQ